MARKVEPQQRLREFEHIVFTGRTGDGGREIDFETFRRQCFAGIPDTPASVRDACWKILLNYTPWADRASWPSSLTTLRSTYYSYVRDLSDPPLSPPDSPTTTTLEDPNAALLQQIYSDVRRTLPDMAFFQLPVPAQWGSRSPLFPVPPTNSDATVSPSSSTTSLPTLTPPTDTRASYPDIPNPFLLYARIAHLYAAEVPPVDLPGTPLHSTSSSSSPPTTESATTTAPHTHADSLLRILYLFARLNPGVGYVQGMNEVLAPLYYVSAHGADAAHAEPDSFFLLTSLLSQFHDHFLRSLDNIGRSARSSAVQSAKGSGRGSREASGGKIELKDAQGGDGDASVPTGASGDDAAPAPATAPTDPDAPTDPLANPPPAPPPPRTPPPPRKRVNAIEMIEAVMEGEVGSPVDETPSAVDAATDASAPEQPPTAEIHIPPRTVSRPQRPHKRRIVGAGGVSHSMGRAWLRLRERDGELWRDLTTKSLHPIFFLFRWLTVLMTQEFPLPEVLRVWDTVLADIALDVCGSGPPKVEPGGIVEWEKRERRDVTWRWDWLVELAVAMIVSVRAPLLDSTFSDCLKLLQNYPHDLVPLDLVLARAYANYDVAVGRGLAGPDRYRRPGDGWDDAWDEEEDEEEDEGVDVVGVWVRQAGEMLRRSVSGRGRTGGASEVGARNGAAQDDEEDGDADKPSPVAQLSQQTSLVFQGWWKSVNAAAQGVVHELDEAVAEGRKEGAVDPESESNREKGEDESEGEAKETGAAQATAGTGTGTGTVPGTTIQESFRRLWSGRASVSKGSAGKDGDGAGAVGEHKEGSEHKDGPAAAGTDGKSAATGTTTTTTAASAFSAFFRPRGATLERAPENASNPFLAMATAPHRAPATTSASAPAPTPPAPAVPPKTSVDVAPIVTSVSTSLQGVWRMLGGVSTTGKPGSTVLFDADAAMQAHEEAHGRVAASAAAGAKDRAASPQPKGQHAATLPANGDLTDGEAWEGGDLDMDDLDAWLEKLGSGTTTPTAKGSKGPSRSVTGTGLDAVGVEEGGDVHDDEGVSEGEDVGNVTDEIEKLLSGGKSKA